MVDRIKDINGNFYVNSHMNDIYESDFPLLIEYQYHNHTKTKEVNSLDEILPGIMFRVVGIRVGKE